MISHLFLITLISLSFEASIKTYSTFDLLQYTFQVLGNSRNFFVLDPDKYLMNSFNFFEAQRLLESLYRIRGMKTFVYICSNINNLSSRFPEQIAFELGKRLDNTFQPQYYFVLVIAAEQRKYFYYVGEKIRRYLPPNYVDIIVSRQSKLFNERRFGDVIMGILRNL